MPFKIVQTAESGKKLPSLSVVPAAWEQGNVLYSPNSKKLSVIKSLIEDGDSVPQDGWLAQECIRKRNNLLSYAAAELEIEEMTRCTDSDVDTIVTENSSKRCVKPKVYQEFDYNDMLPKRLPQQTPLQDKNSKINILANKVIQPSTSSTTSKEMIVDDIADAIPLENVIQPLVQPVLSEVSYNLFDNDSVKSIITNQTIMIERQDQIIKELAVQKAMLEFILQNGGGDGSSNKSSNTVTDDSENIFPLTTTNDIQQFEFNLLEASFKARIINQLSGICGTSGKLKGVNCCYILVDKMFDRELLTKYSWAGGSRDTNNKNCFKSLINIKNTFHQIVAKADRDISEVEVENFFKSVVKNAKRRFELMSINGQKRASRSKHRPSQLKYKKGNDENVLQQESSNINDELLENSVAVDDKSSHVIEGD